MGLYLGKEKISKNVDLLITIQNEEIYLKNGMVKGISQTYKYYDESARKNVQELINYFSLYNLESLSYEYLKKFIKEKFS